MGVRPLQWWALAVKRAKLSIPLAWQRPAQKWPGPHEKDRDKKSSSLKSKLHSCKRNGEGYDQSDSSALLPDLSSPRGRHLSSSFPLVNQGFIFHPSTSNISTAFPTVLGLQNADVYLIKLIGCHFTKSHATRFSKLIPLGIKHLSHVRFSIPLVLFLHIQQVLIFFCYLVHLKVKKQTETK